ncbi:hypothetical protein PSN13_06472 [Micromonospora saelicesensis]|uniref:Uncharacterized protein n=1 Tax=Micromonospora saelicesensis TaxID=285676 RepID=A0A328NIU0_9ACTN|nr:hypothetical protein [Micromonospora saelicesensis]RAO26444.1 hypothetical protein PSN13_06472 [Micromonospora saelicesensis]
MSTKAPKPPTKALLLAAGMTGGISLCLFVMIWIGHVVYDNIPTGRLVAYTLTWVAGAVATAGLAGYYLVQKWRRDAWWDGHAACDDPDADTMPLRRVQAELEELTEAVHSLADAAGRPRPQPWAEPVGGTYTSRAVQNDTVMMVTGSAVHTQVQVAKRQPTDPIAEARVEGYVEGYADGFTRRSEGTE